MQAVRATENGLAVYIVKAGDNLDSIARKSGLSLTEIQKLNPQLKHPDVIVPGMRVNVLAPLATAVTPPSPRQPSKVEFTVSTAQGVGLGEAQKNAYAVYQALASEPSVVASLKRAMKVDNPADGKARTEYVGSSAIEKLALAAKSAGYPLTADGMAQLKAKHEITEEGIGPKTANALVDEILDAARAPGFIRSLFMSKESRFIEIIGPAAVESMAETGVPASVTMAQCILETGWGKHALGKANNYFGIKGKGPAGSVTVPTKEYIGGEWVAVRAKCRAYNSIAESFIDHGKLLSEDPRYARAMAANNDAKDFARKVQRAGYATAPDYAAQLIKIMDQYDLYRFDRQSPG